MVEGAGLQAAIIVFGTAIGLRFVASPTTSSVPLIATIGCCDPRNRQNAH